MRLETIFLKRNTYTIMLKDLNKLIVILANWCKICPGVATVEGREEKLAICHSTLWKINWLLRTEENVSKIWLCN